MKLLKFILCLSIIIPAFANPISAQTDSSDNKQHIAVFIPLYLDSAFDTYGAYKHGKTLPRYFNAGLDLYQGIQLAMDSLNKENIPLELHIYDTRAPKKIETILEGSEWDSMDLIIGHVTVNEAALLARTATSLQIPFVNINLPNDANVKDNPNYIVLNPTLITHLNGMYKFVQKNYALSPILYFKKKSSTDDRIKQYFEEAQKNSSSVPLKVRYVNLEDTLEIEQLAKFLDSNKNTLCIAGTLDGNFGLTLTRQLASLSKSYKTTVLGMPTWDEVDFSKSAYRGIEIIYSSPHFHAPDNKLVWELQSLYKTKYFSTVGEMVYRGFETVYLFSHLLTLPGDSLSTTFASHKNTIFGEIDIQPVLNKQTRTTDYFENKKLYFIKSSDGVKRAVQ
ncbi:MAG: amino acid ABC transporter substrate-binding protein [Chitinophagaceae bacterium]|nr:amino acid ABC transporter substrate-binding protein [Chitinophagaceae bacterium]